MYQVFNEVIDEYNCRAMLRVGRLIKTPASALSVAKRKSIHGLAEVRDMSNRIVAIFRGGQEIGHA